MLGLKLNMLVKGATGFFADSHVHSYRSDNVEFAIKTLIVVALKFRISDDKHTTLLRVLMI